MDDYTHYQSLGLIGEWSIEKVLSKSSTVCPWVDQLLSNHRLKMWNEQPIVIGYMLTKTNTQDLEMKYWGVGNY